MTASTIGAAPAASTSSSFGRLAGFRALVRKDTTDWVRSRRVWVILLASVPFMALTAANGWITNQIAAGTPPGAMDPDKIGSLSPVDNFLAGVSAQLFVVVTIFVAGSLLSREREAGTLGWIASKPVSRASIWLSKWTTTTAMTALVAGIVPLLVSFALVTVLYGAPPAGLVVGAMIGVVAAIAFFSAVGLGLATVLPGQAATIAATFAVFAFLPMIGGFLPIEEFLPMTMLSWPVVALSGGSVAAVTPVAWLVITGSIVALSVRRTARLEL
jgi:ABC-2 type transport system permease protein